MHTRRESGRDVNRGEKAAPPPRPPPHARTAFRPPPGPAPEGWRGPCPPLCSAAGTAARRAHAPAPPRGWGHGGAVPPATGPPASFGPGNTTLGSLGSARDFFFFFLGVGGWLGVSPPPPPPAQPDRAYSYAGIYLMKPQIFISFPLLSRSVKDSHLELS